LEAGEERGVLEAVDTLALPKSGAEGICLCGHEPRLGDLDDDDMHSFGAVQLDLVVRMLVVRVFMVVRMLMVVRMFMMVRMRVVVRVMRMVAVDFLQVDRLETHIFPEHVRNVGCLGAHAATMVRPVRNNVNRSEVRNGRSGRDNGICGGMSETKVSEHISIVGLNMRHWCLSAHSGEREGSDQKAGRNTHDDVCWGFLVTRRVLGVVIRQER